MPSVKWYLFLVGAADKTITSFEIHPDARYVGDYAFGECEKLKSAVLPNTVEHYGETLFIMCYELESITLPTGVEVIDGYAFSSCSSLKTVYLPGTVNEIRYDIFHGATSLTDVYFDGTVEEWNSISFRSDWADGQNGFTVHCTDGDVTVEAIESDW